MLRNIAALIFATCVSGIQGWDFGDTGNFIEPSNNWWQPDQFDSSHGGSGTDQFGSITPLEPAPGLGDSSGSWLQPGDSWSQPGDSWSQPSNPSFGGTGADQVWLTPIGPSIESDQSLGGDSSGSWLQPGGDSWSQPGDSWSQPNDPFGFGGADQIGLTPIGSSGPDQGLGDSGSWLQPGGDSWSQPNPVDTGIISAAPSVVEPSPVEPSPVGPSPGQTLTHSNNDWLEPLLDQLPPPATSDSTFHNIGLSPECIERLNRALYYGLSQSVMMQIMYSPLCFIPENWV